MKFLGVDMSIVECYPGGDCQALINSLLELDMEDYWVICLS